MTDETPPPPNDSVALRARRREAVRLFVRETYGPWGTLRLHRAALGLDLLRAPANVALAPIFLIVRIVALVAALLRLRGLAGWLLRRRILFETNVSAHVGREVHGFLRDLDARGLGVAASPETVARAVADYSTVRNAVAEITTSLIVLALGFAVFHSATPGVLSLAGPIADLRAQASAIAGFPLGERLGGVWYGMFPASHSAGQLVLTALVLSMIASVVTTFAGLVADPLQAWAGVHDRRLMRLLGRLDRAGAEAPALAGEHLTARIGDITDIVLGIWRAIRG